MMRNGPAIDCVPGDQLAPWIDALGALRIRVFREYPYLYDGTLDYERRYLDVYRNSPRSMVILVTGGDGELVGASTCLPLRDECAEFQEPFVRAGWRVEDICYFGESILLPEWRGMGLGGRFFDLREQHARDIGCETAAFCAVDRPSDHPSRPAAYQVLDSFWQRRGFRRQDDLKAMFSWREIGEDEESAKSLTFWTKTWNQ